jgi:hypothetical protein
VHAARLNLRTALAASHLTASWREWNLSAADAPERFRSLMSPTILVNGVPVGGPARAAAGSACRAEGAPTVEMILAALERTRSCA